MRKGSYPFVDVVLNEQNFELGLEVADLSERPDEMSVGIPAVGGPVVHSDDDSALRQVGRLRRHDPDFWQPTIERTNEEPLAAADFADGL